ncbi:hypothetical protein [Bacteroides sp.]
MNISEEKILEEFIKKEDELGLNDVRYMKMPLWRLFRSSYRIKYIKARSKGYNTQTAQRETALWLWYNVKYFILSTLGFAKLLIYKRHYDNIVFSFPRLQRLNDSLYIDKFTDPVIDRTNIKKSVCVFQFINRKIYRGRRWEEDRVIRMEFVVYFSVLLSVFLCPIIAFSARNEIKSLYNKLNHIYRLRITEYVKWCIKLSFFKCEVDLYRFIFKKIKCKKVYVVNRMVCLPQIVAAHQCDLLVLEFQHGVTLGNTILYSGRYDAVADPDYFLIFGEVWRGSQFAIPLDKIVNIGWAYKDVINKLPLKDAFHKNACLVVSSPEISDKLVETILLLAREYPSVEFHIRCHPQESLSTKAIEVIKTSLNVQVADNKIDSFMALRTYSFVIGENSSVLFEALSMGKKVARLNFNGFNPIPTHVVNDGFCYIYDLKDFKVFLDSKNNHGQTGFYNDFNPDNIHSIY